MEKAKDPSTFVTLDGLRGLGALLVVVGHTAVFWGWLDMPTAAVCVDFFFLLSGFVIAFAYEPKFARGMKISEFMQQRVIRLYPLYLLGLLMGAVVQYLALMNGSVNTAEGLTGSFILQFFMLPGLFHGANPHLYVFNIPAWSLLFELWANLIYILLFPILSNRVLVAMSFCFAALLAYCVGAFGSINIGASYATIGAGFARAGFSFFAGVLVYRFAGSPRRPSKTISPWACLVALVPIAVAFIPRMPGASMFIELALVCFVGPLLIHTAQAIQPPKFATKTFVLLGGASYAIYMIHFPVFEFMQRVAWRYPILQYDWAPWSGLAILLVVMAMGLAAERWFDRPLRGWVTAKLKERAKRKAAPTYAPANSNTQPAPAPTTRSHPHAS